MVPRLPQPGSTRWVYSLSQVHTPRTVALQAKAFPLGQAGGGAVGGCVDDLEASGPRCSQSRHAGFCRKYLRSEIGNRWGADGHHVTIHRYNDTGRRPSGVGDRGDWPQVSQKPQCPLPRSPTRRWRRQCAAGGSRPRPGKPAGAMIQRRHLQHRAIRGSICRLPRTLPVIHTLSRHVMLDTQTTRSGQVRSWTGRSARAAAPFFHTLRHSRLCVGSL